MTVGLQYSDSKERYAVRCAVCFAGTVRVFEARRSQRLAAFAALGTTDCTACVGGWGLPFFFFAHSAIGLGWIRCHEP